jgi:hypothetical protein
MEEEKSSNLTLNVCIWPIISVLSSKETIQCTPFFSLMHIRTVEILLK